MAILHESDEGTMHEVRKIAAGGRRGRDRKVACQNEYTIISKSEPYMLDASLGKNVTQNHPLGHQIIE